MSLTDHPDPAVRVIAHRAGALHFEAQTLRSEEVIALYGRDTAFRMAIGKHAAAKELERLAQDIADGNEPAA